MLSCPHYGFLLLDALHVIALQLLQRYTILTVSAIYYNRCGQAMGDVMSLGIRVDWLNQTHEDREFQLLFQKVATFRMQVKEAEAYLHRLKDLLNQAKESLAKKNTSPASMTNYKIKILELLHLDAAVSCLALCLSFFFFCNGFRSFIFL